MAGHDWREKTSSFYGRGGVVTRRQSKGTGYGRFSNLDTSLSRDDKVTRATTVDAATGTSSVIVHVSYYRDGTLVLQRTGRTVYNGAGNVVRQSGIPNDPNRTVLCDLWS